ncbi:MAG: mycofactocin biosynthesis peptidyl-dipeptidase MftE [Actinomycetota bacterium]
MARLVDLTTPDVGTGRTLVLPLGATEQHGPHLPLDTDTVIARAVAETAALRVDDAVVAPAIAIGASGEHQGFPGTLSVGTDVLASMLVEIVRTAGPEFDRIVVVNAHGGNLDAVGSAVATCEHEGRPILVWHARLADADADAHAGSVETSVMLAIDPVRVRLDRAEPGNTAPMGDLLDELRRGGVAAVSPNGVLGDPRDATPGRGEEILAEWVRQVVALLES